MTISLRWLGWGLVACAIGVVHAQPRGPSDYPSKPIRLLIGAPPGGDNDVLDRVVTKIQMVHIPFKGSGPAISARGGQRSGDAGSARFTGAAGRIRGDRHARAVAGAGDGGDREMARCGQNFGHETWLNVRFGSL